MTNMITILGAQLASIIDPETLKSVGIHSGTVLEVRVSESGIHIAPTGVDHASLVLASALKMMALHDATFRKLAQ